MDGTSNVVRDPGTLPENMLRRRLWKAIVAPSDRASNVALLVTLAASAGALWLLGSNWLLPAATVGLATRLALLTLEGGRHRYQYMALWREQRLAEDWARETGTPLYQGRGAHQLWLESPAASKAPATRRADTLRATGALDAARAVLDGAVGSTPAEVADLACSRFELDFDATGAGDLRPWREAITKLAEPEARYNRVEMAFYEASMDLGTGRDWLATLEGAYSQNGPFSLPLLTRLIPFLNRLLPVAAAIGLIAASELIASSVRLP